MSEEEYDFEDGEKEDEEPEVHGLPRTS